MSMFTAEDIAELRKALGWSVVQLAAHLKVHRTTVYHWESGRCHPRFEEMAELNRLARQVGFQPQGAAAKVG
jgi:DNA-binding transcriptional regulator YiaG